MTLSDLASISTVLSSLAVFASLVYLGIQTGQNTKHTRAMVQQARNQLTAEQTVQIADPAIADIFMRGDAGDRNMDRLQMFAYINIVISQLYIAEDMFYQHREGLIDDERHSGSVNWIRFRLMSSGFRAGYRVVKDMLGPDVQRFIESLMPGKNERESPPDLGTYWKALVEEETR